MGTKAYTFLVLLLSLGLPALSDKCPDEERLPTTCDCEDVFVEDEVDIELSCSASSLQEFKDALNLMDKSSRLEVHLEDMALETLPSRILEGWNVVRLDISHCEMDSLAPEGEVALVGLEDKLEVLTITSSFTEDNRPTKIDLSHLKRLRELDLSYDAVTELSNDWFANGPISLESLILSNNGIVKIGDKAFAKLTNLQNLELHGNRFGQLRRSMLPTSASQLQNLELDNNDLTSVPDDLFSDMPALRKLSIRTNGIFRLQEKAFKPIWSQLDIFDARGNPLECNSAMRWMFSVQSKATILGTCEDPLGGIGSSLEDFIKNKGQ